MNHPNKPASTFRAWHLVRTAALFLQVISAAAIFAQPLPAQLWDSENGLSNNWVSEVLQDSRGFCWIGTQYGVNKFDGYGFQHFSNDPDDPHSMATNWVRSIAEDAEGHLWFGLYGGGLERFNPYTEHFTHFPHDKNNRHSLPDNEVYKVFCDRKNRLWAATFAGVAWCHPGKGSFHQENTVPSYGLCEDAAGILWLAAADGLSFWQNDHFEPLSVLQGKEVYAVAPAGEGKLWAFTEDGLQSVEKKGTIWELSPPELPLHLHPNRHFLPTVFTDRKGRTWAGADGGLFLKNNETQTWELQEQLAGENIHSLSEDRSGNCWVGTGTGLVKLTARPNLFNQSEASAFLANMANVREVLPVDGAIWYAVPDGLFVSRGSGHFQVLDLPINCLLQAGDGMLYAGPSNQSPPGIFRILPATGKAEFLPFPQQGTAPSPNLKVWCMAEDLTGHIWIGAQGCLYRFDPANGIFQPFLGCGEGQANDIFIDLKMDALGQLWAGTLHSGLFCLKNPHLAKGRKQLMVENFRHSRDNLHSLSNDLVVAIYIAQDGAIWVGTDCGLNRLDPATGSFQRFLKKDGLLDEKIMAISGDAAGRIWASTGGHGIFCMDTTGHIRHFGKKEGLASEDFLLSSVYRSEDGRMFFGSVGGMAVFQPDTVMQTRHLPAPLYFTDCRLVGDFKGEGQRVIALDSSINFLKNLTIPPGKHTLALQFAALGLSANDNVQYEYRLIGLMDDWQELGTARELTLGQLPPGRFQLQVKTEGNPIGKEGTMASVHLTILPPWYRTWWAYSLWLALLLGSLYVAYRFRLRQKLQEAETRRLRELDEVKTRLYTNITHEFRTPLTVIGGVAGHLENKVADQHRGDLHTIQRNNDQVLNLVNQMLDLAKLESGHLQLDMVQGDVVVFLKYILESFHSLAAVKNISLQFSSSTDSFSMDYDPECLRQIVSNLLANAVKFTPEGGRVELELDTWHSADSGHGTTLPIANRLLLTVKDTGPGIPPGQLPHIFDRFYQADDSAIRQVGGTGIGLTLAKELVKLLGGKIKVKSKVGEGTIFTVNLPVSRSMNQETRKPAPAKGRDEAAAAASMAAVEQVPNSESPPLLEEAGGRLLLVEDNPDVVRYITEILQKDYQVRTAANGRIGLEMAVEEAPDIVLSDVMMPEMDGFEFCRRLKNGAETSHLPVVLLTARADAESKIEGLEMGADAYLPKPFHEKELLLTIKNLLENRAKMQRFFTSGEFISGSKNRMSGRRADRETSRDEAFLQSLLIAVEANLDNPDLSAEGLADILHHSYSSLFKKIKALTGMGVTEYIRHIRLHRAAAMLRGNPDLTISQVSMEVGFNSLQFFSREFKKNFKVSPAKYSKGGSK